MNKSALKKFQEKAFRFHGEVSRVKKTPYMRALDPYIKYMPLLALSLGMDGTSKHLLFSLTASMEGMVIGKNKLGLISEDLDKTSQLVAQGLFACTHQRGEIEAHYFKTLIMGTLVTLTGLLWLVHDQHLSKEKGLFEELVLRALFASEIPKTAFKHLSQAFGVEDKTEIASLSLESLALLFAILAFSSVAEASELLEGVRLRCLKNFQALENALNDLVLTGKATRETTEPLRLFISQGKRTLENRNFELFLKGLNELTHPYDISIANLQEDIQTSRRLFSTLGTHFRMAAREKDNVILFAG